MNKTELEKRQKKNIGYWLWATFNHENEIAINKLKSEINLNGPEFKPHLTICGPTNFDNIQSKYKTILNYFNENEIILEIDNIICSNSFYKAIYLNVTSNIKLNNLNKFAEKTLCIDNYDFCPHISLHYGKIAREKKHLITNNLKPPLKFIKLDKLNIVFVDEKNEKWELIN